MSVLSHDELKSSSATMGMVIFCCMSGRPDEKLKRFLDLGIAICDIIEKGPALASSVVATYHDFAKVEAFRALDRRTRAFPGKLSGLETQAQGVRQTLEMLQSDVSVSDEDLKTSASFFSKIYCAM